MFFAKGSFQAGDGQAHTSNPRFCTAYSSLSATALGCLLPVTHFLTVDSLLLRYLAKTGWVIWALSLIYMTLAGSSAAGVVGYDASNWHSVVTSIAPSFCKAAAEV